MTSSSPLLASASALGLAAYCLSHLFLVRVFPFRGPYIPLLASFVVGMAIAAGTTLWGCFLNTGTNRNDTLAFLAMNVLAYIALGWCYFHFVNLCIASLRIRILEELFDAGGELPGTAIELLYDNRKMIDTRITRLTRGGHLTCREGRYYPGKRTFLFVARVFDLFRWLILGSDHSRHFERPAGNNT